MKIKLLYTLLLLISIGLQSQNKLADSLVSVLNSTENKTDQLILLNKISNAYKTSSGKEVITYGNKALELSIELDSKIQEGHVYVNLGNGNIILGNYDKSVKVITQKVFKVENVIKD